MDCKYKYPANSLIIIFNASSHDPVNFDIDLFCLLNSILSFIIFVYSIIFWFYFW